MSDRRGTPARRAKRAVVSTTSREAVPLEQILAKVKAQLEAEQAAPLRTPSEILAEPNPKARAEALESYVREKARRHGREALTPAERVALYAVLYRDEVFHGGLTSTVVWDSDEPDYRDACIAALETIGATTTAAILREAAAILDAVPEHRRESARTVEAVIDLFRADYERLRQDLDATNPKVEIESALARWIDAHASELRES